MPFGINSTPEIFQKRMPYAFEDLKGVKTIADDILAWEENEKEHTTAEQVKKGGIKAQLRSTARR